MRFRRIEDVRVDAKLEKRLPMPDSKEFTRLVDDVKERGILVDLLVTKDGLLLDGHRRLMAAKAAGIDRVPVKEIQLQGDRGWEMTVAIAVNLNRRHLSEAERANLGSSLLRIERRKAKERQRDGQRRGREHRRDRSLVVGNRSPQPARKVRATEKVAEAVGVSRKTFERVEKIKKAYPELAQAVLSGRTSIAAAYEKVRAAEREKLAHDADPAAECEGRLTRLSDGFGRYRTVYLDPSRCVTEAECRRGRGRDRGLHGLGKVLAGLPLHDLARRDGCHFWIWTPWPMIRERVIHRVLRSWQLRWIGEFI